MIILARLSPELVIKSNKVRSRFLKQLIANTRKVFANEGLSIDIDNQWSRFFLTINDNEANKSLALLQTIFGYSSFSTVGKICSADITTICKEGEHYFADSVKDKTYGVFCKRTGKHNFSSVDVAQSLGAALRPFAKSVELKQPESRIDIEIRDQNCYFFDTRVKAAGGLPVGTGGRSLCLISGGFDSVVAAWYILKRGIDVDFVLYKIGPNSFVEQVLEVVKALSVKWSSARTTTFTIVDFQGVADNIKANANNRYAQVLLKRMFYLASDKLCAKDQYDAFLTGECIAQVSSQTLQNLATIEYEKKYPVLRPLIAFDKQDIIDLARDIGVYELCAEIKEYCQLVPDKPVTSATIDSVLKEEAKLDMTCLDQALNSIRYIKVTKEAQFKPQALYVSLKNAKNEPAKSSSIFTTEIPSEAILIDLRSKEEFDERHIEKSIQVDFDLIIDDDYVPDPKKTYVFYCTNGMKSAVAAEHYIDQGIRAFALKGKFSNFIKNDSNT